MDFLFPHRVEYKISGPISVEEVIETLRANQAVTSQLGSFLEDIYPGLTISSVELRVEEVTLASLKELFVVALVAVYQDELNRRVPELFSHYSGVEIPTDYNAVVTFAFLLILYLGADFLQKFAIEKVDAAGLRYQIDHLVSELSRLSQASETDIRRALDKRYAKRSVATELAKAAYEFFRPSRTRNDEPIVVDHLMIEPEVIKAVPKYINSDALEEAVTSSEFSGVRVEIRATDVDKDSQGWAGIVPTVSDRRMAMKLFPGINRERLRKKPNIVGDIIVYYKEKDGQRKPSSFHLIRFEDGDAT